MFWYLSYYLHAVESILFGVCDSQLHFILGVIKYWLICVCVCQRHNKFNMLELFWLLIKIFIYFHFADQGYFSIYFCYILCYIFIAISVSYIFTLIGVHTFYRLQIAFIHFTILYFKCFAICQLDSNAKLSFFSCLLCLQINHHSHCHHHHNHHHRHNCCRHHRRHHHIIILWNMGDWMTVLSCVNVVCCVNDCECLYKELFSSMFFFYY